MLASMTHQMPLQSIAKPSRKHLIWIIVIVTLVLPLGGLAAYGFFVGYDVELKQGDRERMFTVADLQLVTVEEDPAAAKTMRTMYLDGSHTLEYEYETDELYLYSMLSRERTPIDARNVYNAQLAGASLMSQFQDDVELENRDDLAKWGDQSLTRLVKNSGREVGYYVNARKNNDVLTLIVVGVVYGTEGDLQDVVSKAFDRAVSD